MLRQPLVQSVYEAEVMHCLFLERVVQHLSVSGQYGDTQLLPHALPFPLYLEEERVIRPRR